MKRISFCAVVFSLFASLQGAQAPCKFPEFPQNIPTEDFDMLRFIIQESTAITDPSEATSSTKNLIETPHIRLIADTKEAQPMVEDESDSDQDMSDAAYLQRHKQGERREKRDGKDFERLQKATQAKNKRAASNWHRPKVLQIQCTECGKWHNVSNTISLKDVKAMQADKQWTCWENYWEPSERFCRPFDILYTEDVKQ